MEATAVVTPKPDTPEPKSALALQNDLYARASAERNSGRAAEALALYMQLIIQFPGSALVESAYVQRMRLLARTHDSRATVEAQRYLNRFPEGFARTEAQLLLNSP
jgi:outer membrane protein assembly factor BamD (BamD/ComL family)